MGRGCYRLAGIFGVMALGLMVFGVMFGGAPAIVGSVFTMTVGSSGFWTVLVALFGSLAAFAGLVFDLFLDV